MKKLTSALVVIISFTVFQMNAQSNNWKSGRNEINVGLRPFALGIKDFQYKTKVGHKNWMRISLTDLGLADGETGIRLGIEKQNNLALRTRIIYGLEAGTYVDYDRIDNTFANYNVDLGIPVGVQFHLTKRILFGIETRPSIGIYESYIDDDTFGRVNNFGTGIKLFGGYRGTLGYRF